MAHGSEFPNINPAKFFGALFQKCLGFFFIFPIKCVEAFGSILAWIDCAIAAASHGLGACSGFREVLPIRLPAWVSLPLPLLGLNWRIALPWAPNIFLPVFVKKLVSTFRDIWSCALEMLYVCTPLGVVRGRSFLRGSLYLALVKVYVIFSVYFFRWLTAPVYYLLFRRRSIGLLALVELSRSLLGNVASRLVWLIVLFVDKVFMVQLVAFMALITAQLFAVFAALLGLLEDRRPEWHLVAHEIVGLVRFSRQLGTFGMAAYIVGTLLGSKPLQAVAALACLASLFMAYCSAFSAALTASTRTFVGIRVEAQSKKGRKMREGKEGPRVPGVRVGGLFISRARLKRAMNEGRFGTIGVDVWVPCLSGDEYLTQRQDAYVRNLSRPVVTRMLQSLSDYVLTLEAQGLTLSCPDHSTGSGIACSGAFSPTTGVQLSIAPGPSPPPAPAIMAQGGESFNVFITASYVAVGSGLGNDFLEKLGIKPDLVLDFLAILKMVVQSDGNMDLAMALHSLARKAGPTVYEAFIPVIIPQSKGAGIQSLVDHTLEALTIAVLCSALGLTREFADLQGLSVYLRTVVVDTARDVVSYLVGVVRVLASGDFSDFFTRVSKAGTSSEMEQLRDFGTRLDIIKQQVALDSHLPSLIRGRAQVLWAQVEKQEDYATREGRTAMAARLKLVGDAVGGQLLELDRKVHGACTRKEPLGLFVRGAAGIGKGTLTAIYVNVLARIFGVSAEDAAIMLVNWSLDSPFQESYNGRCTRAVLIDELLSVNVDYDPYIGALLNSLLGIVSSNVQVINQAFEGKKGKNDTKELLLVAINSNCDEATIRRLYAGEGENFFRRFLEVEMTPLGDACVNGKFVPGNIPRDERSLETLDSLMRITVRRMDIGHVGDVVFTGGYLTFSDWLEGQLRDRLAGGASDEVNQWFYKLRSYKVTPQSLSLDLEDITKLLIIGFVGWVWSKLYSLGGEYRQVTRPFRLAARVATGVHWSWLEALDVGLQGYDVLKVWALKHRVTVEEVIIARNRLRVTRLLRSLRASFDRLVALAHSPVVKAVIAASVVAGVAFGVKRKLASGGGTGVPDASVVAQAYSMPREVVEHPELSDEVRQIRGVLVPIMTLTPDMPYVNQVLHVGAGIPYPALDKIRDNLVVITVGEGNNAQLVHGSRIGSAILTVAHVFEPGLGSYLVELTAARYPGARAVYKLAEADLMVDRKNDLVCLPNVFPTNVKDLSKLLKGASRPRPGERVCLVGATPEDDILGVVEKSTVPIEYEVNGYRYSHTGIATRFERPTQRGDCGLWLVSLDSGTFLPVGQHVGAQANDPTLGTSASWLDCGVSRRNPRPAGSFNILAVEGITIPQCCAVPDIVYSAPRRGFGAYRELVLETQRVVMGSSPIQALPPGSRLVPSRFRDVVVEEMASVTPDRHYEPAVMNVEVRYNSDLGVNHFVSPFQNGMARDRAGGAVDFGILEEFRAGFLELSKRTPREPRSRFHTIDEALAPIDGYPAVNPTKSSGLPEGGPKGAYMWREERPGSLPTTEADARWRTAVANLIALNADGVVVSHVSKGFLKDELRPREKIVAVETRLVECLRADYYALSRMVLAEASQHMTQVGKGMSWMIGVNASSPAWAALYARTNPALGGEELSADFKKMDKRMLYLTVMLFADVLFSIVEQGRELAEVERRLVAAHLMGMMCPQSLVDGALFYGFAGNLTGQFVTTILNTFASTFYFFHAFRRAGYCKGFDDYVERFTNRMAFYGDDSRYLNLHGVEIDEVTRQMAWMGQIVQSAGLQKSTLVSGSGGKTFLKRGFTIIKVPGFPDIVGCPLEVESLLKSLLYCAPSGSVDQNVRDFAVLRTVWEEAFFHEAEVKSYLRALVQRLVLYLPPEYHQPRWKSDEELAARWFAGEFRVWEL